MTKRIFALRVEDALMDRIHPVLRGGETRPAFVREAVIREIERRETIVAKRPMAIERFEEPK